MDFEKLVDLTKKEYEKYDMRSHDWKHVLNVKQNAEKISVVEKANLKVVLPAAILHDLGRFSKDSKPHSQNTLLAEKLLQEAGYEKQLTEEIVSCIKEHSFDAKPGSLNSKVLFDADKLDSYGAIGIARFFTMAGEKKWGLEKSSEDAFQRITALSKAAGFYTKEGERLGLTKAKKSFMFYYLFFRELGENSKAETMKEILIKKYGKIKGAVFLKALNKIFE